MHLKTEEEPTVTAAPLGSLDAGQHLDGKRENRSII